MGSRYTVSEKSLKNGLDRKTISAPAMDMMKRYDWPGNVRELENLVRRLLVLIDDQIIEAHHLFQMAIFPSSTAGHNNQGGQSADKRVFLILPGIPRTIDPSGISIPSVTNALAPIIQFLPIFAPLRTTDPIPIKLPSPISQP